MNVYLIKRMLLALTASPEHILVLRLDDRVSTIDVDVRSGDKARCLCGEEESALLQWDEDHETHVASQVYNST